MEIKRNYYDITRKEIEDISKSDELQGSLISDSEAKENVRKIIQICEKKYGSIERICNESKIIRFERISKKMLEAAELMGVNIHIKTEDSLMGWITIEGDYTWLDSEYNTGINYIMAELFMTASNITISVKSGLYNMEFVYELYDEITKTELNKE